MHSVSQISTNLKPDQNSLPVLFDRATVCLGVCLFRSFCFGNSLLGVTQTGEQKRGAEDKETEKHRTKRKQTKVKKICFVNSHLLKYTHIKYISKCYRKM